ncbi:MAG: molybdopterin-dependent oxidoreductase [Oscillospiraceae bacterium]|nr:molybdopterin-dependent oxidoreductase [Oscillospiraceae bacterium]
MREINYEHGKIPCAETGIEVKHTLCDICTPGMHCGLDVLVRDGNIVKVEGTDGFPVSNGKLCTKGAGTRQYVCREDRILTPLKRTGKRGEGKFEPISWDEAIDLISDRFLSIRREYGADKAAFYCGYGKYFRFMLRRFAGAFGTQNYGTESSSCFTSGLMAWLLTSGSTMGMNMPNSQLMIGWGANGYYSRYPMARNIPANRKRGMKVIIVDPRITPASQRLADLHLRPRLGTDGALALAIANVLISRGWIDKPYIDKYVYGFEEYAAYVSSFTPERGQELTGVPAADIVRAAEMIHDSKGICIPESSTLGHHRNGMQNYRAIMSLLVITGNFDVIGGQIPGEFTFMDRDSGFPTHEEEFMDEQFPYDAPKAVGADRFPLWYHLRRDMQSNALADNILKQDEHSVRALLALGMNYRMFADDARYIEAIKKLDIFVDTDLFMSDTAKYADIVLPVCSSLEREQFITYPGGLVWYSGKAIEPIGQAKTDTEVLSLLARRMDLNDPLLKEGYDACISYVMRDIPVTVEEMKASEKPFRIPGFTPYKFGSTLEKGLKTPTGKLELYSTIIADHPEWGLDPLPTYKEPYNPDPEAYPFRLCAGARIPNAIHSRLHDVPWERSLLPEPSVEMSMEDAEALGVELDDDVEIVTDIGALTFKAIPTATVMPGDVFIYHGYREKDINSILNGTNLDPYTGFPAYRSAYCNVRRKA